MCNLYLQDRDPAAKRTPRWRGVTALRELKAAGVPVIIASDNTRDPFYAYGDLDMLEVLREGTRILHLDCPPGDGLMAVTATPAALMGMDGLGRLQAGASADLVLFRARSLTELLARPQADRAVIRSGMIVDAPLPDYRELDHLFTRV
jgi:cytosine deaminase